MIEETIEVEPAVKFEGSNGGEISIIGLTKDVHRAGVEDGWVVFDDLYLNPEVDMTLNVSDYYDITGSVKHLTGDAIITFNLTSQSPNGKADVRVRNLKPREWYRLQFDSILAATGGGHAHAESGQGGEIEFTEVEVPY